jgi:hypothetical protein
MLKVKSWFFTTFCCVRFRGSSAQSRMNPPDAVLGGCGLSMGEVPL